MSTGIKFINPTNNKINLLQRNKHEIFRKSIENREPDSSLLREVIFCNWTRKYSPFVNFYFFCRFKTILPIVSYWLVISAFFWIVATNRFSVVIAKIYLVWETKWENRTHTKNSNLLLNYPFNINYDFNRWKKRNGLKKEYAV